MAWTDERIGELKRLWDDGLTASQIADALGGVSRNAVIGKAHRLGLKPRPSPVKTTAELEKERHAAATVETQEATVPAAPEPLPAAPTPAVEAAAVPVPPAAEPATPAPSPTPAAETAPKVELRSVGPGGFLRQNPGEQQQPIPPAPPRRLVPSRPSDEVADKTSLLDLNERICRWPLGHPGEPDFHFCGQPVNPGFPYCVDHCGNAYQAQMPRRDRKPPPPMPFGGPRVR